MEESGFINFIIEIKCVQKKKIFILKKLEFIGENGTVSQLFVIGKKDDNIERIY